MYFLPNFNSRMIFLQLLDLQFIRINFGANLFIYLLPLFERRDIFIDLKQGHQFVMLRAQSVQMFLNRFELLHSKFKI